MEINFIANDIVYEVTEDNSYLVGFADDKNEPKEYVIVERALEFDEQDIKLGMDSYYFEYSDQSNSGYGLCSKVVIRQNEIVFSVKHKYEDDITSITVSYKDNAIEDINGVYPCSYRMRYTPDRCSCRLPLTFGSACFWESFRYPKVDMDRHCRRAWQAEANPSRTAGTSRRTSAGLFAEARPPAASSWCVPNTFRPVTTYAHTLHTDDVFLSASPQNTSCIAPPSQMVAAGR